MKRSLSRLRSQLEADWLCNGLENCVQLITPEMCSAVGNKQNKLARVQSKTRKRLETFHE